MNWPHSPSHGLGQAGTFMITAGTYQKKPLFRSEAQLSYLCDSLLTLVAKYEWQLQAWAVFSNHYHFVALSPGDARSLRTMIRHLHSVTAKEINREEGAAQRKVWFQYWESRIASERAYLARLSYVHHNAVRHGLVKEPTNYPWCSAGWFQLRASGAFFRTVMQFPHSRIDAKDDYEVPPIVG